MKRLQWRYEKIPQCGIGDLKIRTRDKFAFGDVKMKTHRITNVDNSLNVLCNCLFRTAQSKIIQIAQIQVSRESLSTPGRHCRTRADWVGRPVEALLVTTICENRKKDRKADNMQSINTNTTLEPYCGWPGACHIYVGSWRHYKNPTSLEHAPNARIQDSAWQNE